MDVTNLGTVYANRVSADTISAGIKGALDPRSLKLSTSDPVAAGALLMEMVYDGADNFVSLSADTGTIRISGVSDPALSTDVVPKGHLDAYVGEVLDARGEKDPVKAASTANVVGTYDNGTGGVGASLTGVAALAPLDGVTIAVGDRVLLKDQTNRWENGIYFLAQLNPFMLTRSTDFNSALTIEAGSFCFVQRGTTQASRGYVQTTFADIIVGVSAIEWQLFTHVPPLEALGQVVAPSGILVRSKTTATMATLLDGDTDAFAVIRSDPTETELGVSYANIYSLMSSGITSYMMLINYLSPGTATPTAGVQLTGTAGSLIPIGNFFDNVGAQLQFDGVSFYVASGGVGGAGLLVGDPVATPFIPTDYTLTYLLDFSIDLKIDATPVAPLANAITIVENYGLPSQLIYPQPQVQFEFDRSMVNLKSSTMTMNIVRGSVKTYDVCLIVGSTTGNPNMFLHSYNFNARLMT